MQQLNRDGIIQTIDKRLQWLRLSFGFLIGIGLIACSSGGGSDGGANGSSQVQVSTLEIATQTVSSEQFLTGSPQGDVAVITGEYRVPQLNTGPLPAVILLHGSGGVASYQRLWAEELNALGIATLLVDSFTGRGLGPGDGSSFSHIVDAYRALEALTSQPEVDPNRVALMGFSRGGFAALYAGLSRFVAMHGPPTARFVAALPFYPFCNWTFIDERQLEGWPIRIFHGTADDTTPIESCQLYTEELQQAGSDIELR